MIHSSTTTTNVLFKFRPRDNEWNPLTIKLCSHLKDGCTVLLYTVFRL